jgi:hypothetical protein
VQGPEEDLRDPVRCPVLGLWAQISAALTTDDIHAFHLLSLRYIHNGCSYHRCHLFIPHVYNHDTRALLFSLSFSTFSMIPFHILQACWRPRRVRRFGEAFFIHCFGLGGFLFREIKIDHISYLLNSRQPNTTFIQLYTSPRAVATVMMLCFLRRRVSLCAIVGVKPSLPLRSAPPAMASPQP